MHIYQNSKQWIFLISFLWMSCSPESQNKDDAANTLSVAFAQTLFSTNQNPSDSVIPEDVQSISPSHRGRFRSNYNEEGLHFQSNACQFNGTFQLERIAALDPIEVRITYKEDISSGTILLQNNSQVTIPGTVSYPDSRTIKYLSNQVGDLYSNYKVTVKNVIKSGSGKLVQDATWTFKYDLLGERGTTPSKITVDCQENGGVNQCSYNSKLAIGVTSSLATPQTVFAQTSTDFTSHFGLQASDANGITLWMYEECKIENGTANIAPLAGGKYLFAKMTGVGVFSIPRALIEQNELYTGSVYQYYKNQNGTAIGQPLYPEDIQLTTIQH